MVFPVGVSEFGQRSEKLAHPVLTFSSINLMETQIWYELWLLCTHEVRVGSLETEICQMNSYKTMIGTIKSTNNSNL